MRLSRLLPALALLGACHSAKEEATAQPLGVKVVPVVRGEVADVVEAAGTLDPPPGMDVKLGPLVAGRLAQVLVAEGDRVVLNQLLAKLEVTTFRDAVSQADAQVAQARAQEENAKAKLARAEKAFAAGVAAGQEVDDARLQDSTARAALRTAQAALSTARNQLGRSELRAPFAGVVAHVFSAAGEQVDAGKPVVEVARTKLLELRAPLAPARAAVVRSGQAAELHVDGLPDRSFPATVVAVAPVIDPTTGAAMVRVRIANPDGALKGGAFARARIVADVHKDVLVVPKQALLSRQEQSSDPGASVELVDSGKAKRQQVELGYQDEKLVEIRSGLSEGQQVVVGGAYALPDGTPLKPEVGETEHADDSGSADAGGEARPLGAR